MNWHDVDDFANEVGEGATFIAQDLADWAGGQRWEASAALQEHRTRHLAAGKRPAYVLGCEGRGRKAQWYVARAKDRDQLLQNSLQVSVNSAVLDIACRAKPVAWGTPAGRLRIRAAALQLAAMFAAVLAAVGLEGDAAVLEERMLGASGGTAESA